MWPSWWAASPARCARGAAGGAAGAAGVLLGGCGVQLGGWGEAPVRAAGNGAPAPMACVAVCAWPPLRRGLRCACGGGGATSPPAGHSCQRCLPRQPGPPAPSLISQAGMERKDVMSKNVAIYKAQAAALEKGAAPGCKARPGRGGGSVWLLPSAESHSGRPPETARGAACRGWLSSGAMAAPPPNPHHPPHPTPPWSLFPPPPPSLPCRAGAGGGQPRQHQRPHPQGERALHPPW